MKFFSFFNIYNNYKHDHFVGHFKTQFKKGKFYGKFTRTI